MKTRISFYCKIICSLMLCAGFIVTGCYDDTDILDQLMDHENRLKELERLTAQQNTNIASLQTIVNALQEKDYVTGIAPVKEGDKVIGYTITFNRSGSVTIYHGNDGENGYVPVIGVKQDNDDQWYWTVDGEWMLDGNGNKVRASAKDGADGEQGEQGEQGEKGEQGEQGEQGEKGEQGITPRLKIIDGYWYVSYDGGNTWEEESLGQATGNDGYTMFAEVTYDEYYIYITMADGEIITLSRISSDQDEEGRVGPVEIRLTEITATTATFTGRIYAEDRELDYINVMVRYSYPDEFSAVDESLSNIIITKPDFGSDKSFSITIPELNYNTEYKYCVVVQSRNEKKYSDVSSFITENVVAEVAFANKPLTSTVARINGSVTGLSEVDRTDIQVGVAYTSIIDDLHSDRSIKISSGEISETGLFSISLSDLASNTNYYYCSYVKYNDVYTYGEVKEYFHDYVKVELSVLESSLTATTAAIEGSIKGLQDSDYENIEIGIAYSTLPDKVNQGGGTELPAPATPDGDSFSLLLDNLTFNTRYYYCPYIKMYGYIYTYGEIKEFTTSAIVSDIIVTDESISFNNASFTGEVSGLLETDKPFIEVGIAYSYDSNDFNTNTNTKVPVSEISAEGTYSISLEGLSSGRKYYYCSYLKQKDYCVYSEVREFETPDPYQSFVKDLNVSSASDLSSSSTSNCYIVTEAGTYKFNAVKGNSNVSVGNVSSCTLLWESYGSYSATEKGDLINGVCYKDGHIVFETADSFAKGNAVIAAKDSNGKILWSWHIWLTDQPQSVVYNNGSIMMDRNLGALTAVPDGTSMSLGLFYQWGRKDPFLNSSSILSNSEASSSISFPPAIEPTPETGTIQYTIENPTSYIYGIALTSTDWLYGTHNNDLWKADKTIYDPCPAGWRVPEISVWTESDFADSEYDSTYKGMYMNTSSPSATWYPAAGYRYEYNGGLNKVGKIGAYWSCDANDPWSYAMGIYDDGDSAISGHNFRSTGCSVRCIQE